MTNFTQSEIDEFLAQQKKDNAHQLEKQIKINKEKITMNTLNFLSVIQKCDDEILDKIVFGILVEMQYSRNCKYSIYFLIETIYCLINENIKEQKDIVKRMETIFNDKKSDMYIFGEHVKICTNMHENIVKCDLMIVDNYAKIYARKIAELLEKQTFAMISTKNKIDDNETIEVSRAANIGGTLTSILFVNGSAPITGKFTLH
jgi:hypothetical protein